LTGPTEAVLIDAQFVDADVETLGHFIADTGKTLTTVLLTHGHADHWFGIGKLIEYFPDARCVAIPSVVEYIRSAFKERVAQRKRLFGDALLDPGSTPEKRVVPMFRIDGRPAQIIEVEQADIAPTGIVYVPDGDVVIAGDAVYNELHPVLGLSGRGGPIPWISSQSCIRW
jgi:glyoxylase-like metal-dependent hydrolase (beta-lactamase superfamily II)